MLIIALSLRPWPGDADVDYLRRRARGQVGVLVRDADALQRASTLDTLVFDKTGTLTEGKPQVVAVTTAGEHRRGGAASRRRAGARIGHPLARAILDKANASALPQVQQFPHPARARRQR